MTSTIERPTRTAEIAAAVEVTSSLLGSTDYSTLPEVWGLDITPGRVRGQVAAYPLSKAAALMEWRHAIPGAITTARPAPAQGEGRWYAEVLATIAGVHLSLWTVIEPTEAQAERLERDPQTAYAVLADLARAAA